MKYPLRILIEALNDVEKVQARCSKYGFQSEADLIEETKAQPLKAAIRLIELFVKNELEILKTKGEIKKK